MENRNCNAPLARALVAGGVHIHPLHPAGKRPLSKHSFKDAKPDAAHWRKDPAALVGVACASVWVMDVDTDKDATPGDSIRAIEAETGLSWRVIEARCELIVRTPSGGLHLYWAHAIGTRSGVIGPNVDTRGHDRDGSPTGYIIAPGNVRADGKVYQIIKGSLNVLTSGGLSQAPLALLYFAGFDKHQRARIVAHPDLKARLKGSPIADWQPLVAAHTKAERDARPRIVLTPATATGMRRQALDDLAKVADDLASLTDGRKVAAFTAAAAVAKYVAHGVLNQAEAQECLVDAWIACGGADTHGLKYGVTQIVAGLTKARNQDLPPLARRYREPSAGPTHQTRSPAPAILMAG